MKAKRLRRQMRKVLRDQLRLMWGKLCGLPFRERLKLAWLLVRADTNLNRAAGRRKR